MVWNYCRSVSTLQITVRTWSRLFVPTGAWTHLGNMHEFHVRTVSQNDNCDTELPPATFCTGDVHNLHTRNFLSLSLAASQ